LARNPVFTFQNQRSGVDSVGSQEIGGNNQAYLKVKMGLKDIFAGKTAC
jgi:hypothetical protein